ncbi:MAG TPA: S53 family peptidase [Mycobacteriales bacterium]|nr:S53 family peptidase [Mycobacteriales bacterium]
MESEPRVRVPGSVRMPIPGAEVVGPVDPGEWAEVTVVLRRRAPLPTGERMGRDELADRYGADPADVELVRSAVEAAGAEVVRVDPASRRMRVAGSVGMLAELFATELQQARVPDGQLVRQRTGALSVPAGLADAVVAVLGLDDRPQGRSRVVRAAAVERSFTPPELAEVYAMPAGTDGAGTTLAIIELGGGFVEADLRAYFAGIGVPEPRVRAVGVDGAGNAPEGDPASPDGEVMLDIEVAGGLAPATDIAVYFAPNTDAGFLDAVSEAAHADPTPTAISISWGQSEDQWTAQARTAMDEAFADAGALGVTVTAAAGDDGSADNETDRRAHVDFPAASPGVLGCGGTTLSVEPTSETVWGGSGRGATGGGVSRTFPLPAYQSAAGVPGQADTGRPGRGVPDVAADADPATGYLIRVDGQEVVLGGTSAVAPLWAALVCRLVQALGGPLGRPHEALYDAAGPGVAPPGFRDVTVGSNGAYDAGPGWDPCTGLGTPDGTALLAALRSG